MKKNRFLIEQSENGGWTVCFQSRENHERKWHTKMQASGYTPDHALGRITKPPQRSRFTVPGIDCCSNEPPPS